MRQCFVFSYQPQRPLTKNGPWVLPKDGQRYPEISDTELVSMTFPASGEARGATYRQRLRQARTALDYLVAEGFAAVAPKLRIYPGKRWAGWGEQKALPQA